MSVQVNQVYEGMLQADGLKVAVICGRFNEFFVSKLLGGAVDTIVRHGGDAKNIDVAWVPGCFELPLLAKKMAETGKYDAIIALGVVIQGGTPHAQLLNAEVSKGLAQVGLDNSLPVSYGIITADNIEQAIERSGTKAGNKGAEAALAAIETANVIKSI